MSIRIHQKYSGVFETTLETTLHSRPDAIVQSPCDLSSPSTWKESAGEKTSRSDDVRLETPPECAPEPRCRHPDRTPPHVGDSSVNSSVVPPAHGSGASGSAAAAGNNRRYKLRVTTTRILAVLHDRWIRRSSNSY